VVAFQQGVTLVGDALAAFWTLTSSGEFSTMRVVSASSDLNSSASSAMLAGAVGDVHPIDAWAAFPHPRRIWPRQIDVATEPVGGGGGAQATLAQHRLRSPANLFTQLQNCLWPGRTCRASARLWARLLRSRRQDVHIVQRTFPGRARNLPTETTGTAPGQNRVDIGLIGFQRFAARPGSAAPPLAPAPIPAWRCRFF